MNIQNDKKQVFLMQGSILAIAGIIVRLIGLVYRIPMIKIIGTEGNGYYTSAYSVYSLFLILSSYSFPTAISKIISQRLANGRFVDIKNVITKCLVLAFFVGAIMFSIMFFGADIISMIHRKPLLSFSLRALAPTLFIMAFLGVFRGIFQGMGNMVPTAISQILEQIFNAVMSVLLSYILFNRGLIANMIYENGEYSYAFGAMGGSIGTGVGAFAALTFLFFSLFTLYGKYKLYLKTNNNYEVESSIMISRTLTLTIIPIIVSSTIYNISSVIDDIIFSNVQTFIGLQETIVTEWGIYGQYHLLFNIPVAISNALTSSIIPSISYSVAAHDIRNIVLKVKYSIKFTALIVLPSFIGMVVLAEPICKVLFDSNNVDILIKTLQHGSIAVVFFSLSTITNGILQGLGLFNKPVKNAFAALIIHIIACFIFLIPMRLGLLGIIYAMIVFSFVLYVLNQKDISRVIKYRNSAFNRQYIITYFLMIMSALIMGIAVQYLYSFLVLKVFAEQTVLFMIIELIICIIVALVIYGLLIILLGVVRKRDEEFIPFISKFSFLLRG